MTWLGKPAGDLSNREAWALLKSLRAAGGALDRRKTLELAGLLGQVAHRFLDGEDPLRKEAERVLPAEARVSPPMATAIIEGMARGWLPGALEQTVRSDFPDPEVLDGFRPDPHGRQLRAVAGTLAFHVGSGNVPGVGATSILRSLLVKCPVLLKPGAGDRILSQLLVRGLEEIEPEVAQAVGVAYWPRGEGGELEALAFQEADRVVVYGGNHLIREMRTRLPTTTPLVLYHHRISLGAVARECLRSESEARSVAREAAASVSTFDQRGCVSPQVIWAEEGGPIHPSTWTRLLAEEMNELARTLPSGPLDEEQASALQQLKGVSEVRKAAGGDDRLWTLQSGSGLVFFDPETSGVQSFSGVGRTVVVKPIRDLAELETTLQPVSSVLQTLGLAAPPQRRRALADSLVSSGITRVTTFAKQPWPPPWWRHDGSGPLLALVRWVTLEDD